MDARPLAVCRVLIGAAAMPLSLEWARPLRAVASGEAVAIPVFEAAPVPTEAAVIAMLGLAVVAGLAMIVGAGGRIPALVASATTGVALLADQQTWSNHVMLFVLLSAYVGLSGAAEAWTVTNRRGTAEVPFWPAFLIMAQATTLYAWTALSKVNDQYLTGEVIGDNLRPWVPIAGGLLVAVSLGSIAIEGFLAFALWVPLLRPVAFLLGAGLHVGIVGFLRNPTPLVPFAVMMAAAYVLFFYDSVVRGDRWAMWVWERLPRVPRRAELVGSR